MWMGGPRSGRGGDPRVYLLTISHPLRGHHVTCMAMAHLVRGPTRGREMLWRSSLSAVWAVGPALPGTRRIRSKVRRTHPSCSTLTPVIFALHDLRPLYFLNNIIALVISAPLQPQPPKVYSGQYGEWVQRSSLATALRSMCRLAW